MVKWIDNLSSFSGSVSSPKVAFPTFSWGNLLSEFSAPRPEPPHDLPPGTQGNQYRGRAWVTPGAAGRTATRGTGSAVHDVSVDIRDLE